MERLLAEARRTEPGFIGDAAGGVESDRVDVSKANGLQIEVQLAAGAGTTAVLNLRQHDAASGGNSADLDVSVPHYVKADADASYTRVDAQVGAISDLDTAAGTVLVEVYKEDMEDDYTHISLEVADPGAARIVSVVYHLDSKLKPAYQQEL